MSLSSNSWLVEKLRRKSDLRQSVVATVGRIRVNITERNKARRSGLSGLRKAIHFQSLSSLAHRRFLLPLFLVALVAAGDYSCAH